MTPVPAGARFYIDTTGSDGMARIIGSYPNGSVSQYAVPHRPYPSSTTPWLDRMPISEAAEWARYLNNADSGGMINWDIPIAVAYPRRPTIRD